MSTKVFVGNLAFRTTDQALVEAFSAHGEVKNGVIITRGRRSLGYGFVEFANAEQASTAVEKMNKIVIYDRQIKVELAKDPADRPEKTAEGEQGPARRRKRDQTDYGNEKPHSTSANTNAIEKTNNTGNSNTRNKRRKPQQRFRRRNYSNADGNSNAPSSSSKPPRAPRQPREEKEKIPSKTTLFVANLPFSVNDAQLLAAFNGAKAKSAHVVQTASGRSRGYGFVEFENEADQLDALKNFNGKPITGTPGNNNSAPVTRNMSVSISHAPSPTTGDPPATSN